MTRAAVKVWTLVILAILMWSDGHHALAWIAWACGVVYLLGYWFSSWYNRP